jgi:DNA adenine methylase Dam
MVDKKTMTLFNYIGGKTWLRNHLREDITNILKDKKVNTYVEPFAGGLGAFLGVYDILLENNIEKVILNDINGKLINFYNIVNDRPQDLINGYMNLEIQYATSIPKEVSLLHKTKDKDALKVLLTQSEAFFKKVRSDFNIEKNELKNAIYLLFLQNHCFNGVYRENSKGFYNTPFNWEAKVFDKDKISAKVFAVNQVFKRFNTVFSNKSYSELDYNRNSLYYLDPPYINEIESQENQYHKDSFGLSQQKLLILKIKDTNFLYSNHDNQLLINEFNKNNIEINVKKIPRKNIISASNESRKTDKIEILVSSK